LGFDDRLNLSDQPPWLVPIRISSQRRRDSNDESDSCGADVNDLNAEDFGNEDEDDEDDDEDDDDDYVSAYRYSYKLYVSTAGNILL
jgi:phosphopantothenoylcysteine synthetase/decarboxylase